MAGGCTAERAGTYEQSLAYASGNAGVDDGLAGKINQQRQQPEQELLPLPPDLGRAARYGQSAGTLSAS